MTAVEVWARIEEYPRYMVSNMGRVRNDETGRVLRAASTKARYQSVGLRRGDKVCVCPIHRLVAEAFVDKPHGCAFVDHIDRDKTNNAASNLRWVTHAQNCANRSINATMRSSGFKGVRFNKSRGKWHARITVGGKTTYLGAFTNEIDAARAYDMAAAEAFGQYACINGV